MLQFKKQNRAVRYICFAVVLMMFVIGLVVAVKTEIWSRDTIIKEYEKHLYHLACTVDHNSGAVLGCCYTELSDLLHSDALQAAEQAVAEGKGTADLKQILEESAVLLMDYADRIIVQDGDKVLLSTAENDSLDYSFLAQNENKDSRLCVDNAGNKKYLALSCPSEVTGYTYYILIDLELYFRRVVSEQIYEDYWIVLYDAETGLAMQNDEIYPEYKIFSEEEIVARDDGYTRIYEQETIGEPGAAVYDFTNSEGNKQTILIYMIPTEKSENQVFATAVAVYDRDIGIFETKINLNYFIAAILIEFSAAVATFMLLHSGRKEKELAAEIASLETEKQLKEEILQQQEQLVHHQKLETIGTMTAGIAHEFNNLLAPIMADSMLILEKSRTTDPEIFENALEIYDSSKRAKKLVANVSRLSHRQTADKMLPLQPEKLVADALSMSATMMPENIAVIKSINTADTILGDESQLGLLLLNLIINAIQVMKPKGGTLTVSVDSDGNDVSISVADTGDGIPEENLETIFNPFFTTKEAGKGTGLGLPIARRVAEDHGGTLRAENLPRGGARFIFTVPVNPQ